MDEELRRQATLRKLQLEERQETLRAARRRAGALREVHRKAMDHCNHEEAQSSIEQYAEQMQLIRGLEEDVTTLVRTINGLRDIMARGQRAPAVAA